MVGDIGIGGDHPVRAQTMTNTDTLDTEKTMKQIKKCMQAGAEFIRLTTQTKKHARNILEIKKKLKKDKIHIPIIADVHFDPQVAFESLKYADKVRINPGNFLSRVLGTGKGKTDVKFLKAELEKGLLPLIKSAKQYKKPLRIGVNQGSVADRIVDYFGRTPRGLVTSLMEYLQVFAKHNFHDLIVSIKSSDPLVMIESNKLLVREMKKAGMDYPIHIGVTEAGSGQAGRVKSIVGISNLLLAGIGDTVRVSLTESPERELPVVYDILQATNRRITKPEFISCPSCGRTLFDIAKISEEVKRKLKNIKLPGIKIAIMGCVVNGFGEMGDADFGYIGAGKGKVNLYYQGKLIRKNIEEEAAVGELVNLICDKTDLE